MVTNQVTPTSVLSMNVELHVSCRKLKDLDIISKSDPSVTLYELNEKSRKWLRFGETEVQKDNLNPDFKTFFTVDYSFEKHQKLRFLVLDKDITDSEEIGYFETSMGLIMGSRNQTLVADLKHDKSTGKRGQIIIRAEAISEDTHIVEFQVAGTKVPNKGGGCLGMCQETLPVFFEVQREVGGIGTNHFSSSYKSLTLNNTLNPIWDKQKMRLARFSNGDPNCRVKFSVKTSDTREVGHVITSANELVDKRIHNINKGGTLEFKDFQLLQVPSFVDYLRGGVEISMACAIDFTASNGDPMNPRSLHYLGPNNQYSNAIM